MAKSLMIQGTSSNAGKSVIVAALCRIYKNRGYKVAPFKSQNMSLNSFTTLEDKEIAIAQVFQAEAAKIEPTADMNPILLKPKGEFISQVIMNGKPVGDMNFYDYQHKYRETALKAIKKSYDKLNEEYDIIIIEGAGSPAEINMRKEDIANMEIAHLADANVILVADIHQGGVFAAIAGTYILLDDYDQSRLKSVIINKFSGNLDILKPGIDKIEEITKIPVLGVIPYAHDIQLPEEDSASLSEHTFKSGRPITIGVIRLPKIANFTDIDPFEYEDDVSLRLINLEDEIGEVDALIIPGTRNTVSDMVALEESGKANEIKKLSKNILIIGVCGGYQMLGNYIYDYSNKESQFGTVKGLGLLDIESNFIRDDKIIKKSKGLINCGNDTSSILGNIIGEEITGFEIHEGTTTINTNPLFEVKEGIGNNDDSTFDGAINGNVIGTYFHGLFDNYNFRRELLNHIRSKKGLKLDNGEVDPYLTKKEENIEKLAKLIEDNVDMSYIDKLIFG